MRQDTARKLGGSDAQIAEQVGETAVAKRCEQHLLDSGFSWEILRYTDGEGVQGATEALFANVLDQVYKGLSHGA